MGTTTVVSELSIVKLLWEGKTYLIDCDEVKESDKQSSEKIFSCNSPDAKKISFGQCEYSIDLSGVFPEHKKLFNWIRERQRASNFQALPQLAIYGYDGGKVVLQSLYRQVYVEDNDRTNSKPFDVKLGALSRAYRNSQNQFI